MPLDIGIGLLAGALFHRLTGIPLLPSELMAVLFVLLPDLDAVIQAVRRRSLHRMDMEHRDLLHVPLLYVPIGTSLAWAVAGPAVAGLFAFLSVAHFVHDSIGIGWGIAWLRPFSRNYYKFLSEPVGDASLTLHNLVAVWTPEQQRAAAARYGNPNWLRDMYLRPQRPYLRLLLLEALVLAAGIAAILLIR